MCMYTYIYIFNNVSAGLTEAIINAYIILMMENKFTSAIQAGES